MAGPSGMCFVLDQNGNPLPQYFNDANGIGGNSEAPYPGDWMLVVTGVPGGTAPSTVAASILSSPVAIPLPWKSKHWQVAYGSLGSAITATPY